MPQAGLIEKEPDVSRQVTSLFEKTRAAYLSARDNPKAYSNKWIDIISQIRNKYDDEGDLANTIVDNIREKDLFSDEIKNPESKLAQELYLKIKEMRYGKIGRDPFVKEFGDNVLEALMENKDVFAKFIHWAMRSDKEIITGWKRFDVEEDTITAGYTGLDMLEKDITTFIIEHYGDDKDSSRIDGKYKAAKNMLKEVFLMSQDEEEWNSLVDLDIQKSQKKSANFLVPNKPMYRIFELDDIKELRGFTGDWLVQEKYDGMRIQIHKIDNEIKIYSYNEKDITDKCKDILEQLKKKHFGDCILDAELLLFEGETPLHRAEVVARIFKDKKADTTLKAHVFDIMRHEERDLIEEPLSERIAILFQNYSMHSHELLAFPSKKDTRIADSLEDVGKYAKDIMKIPTSEGVVIKDMTSTYFRGTKKNPKWIKWKKFVDLDLVVLDKKSTKSNLFSYTLGAGPVDKGVEIDGRFYMDVGKALNTKIDVDVGSIVRVKVDEVKRKGDSYRLFSAKVIEIPEVEQPDKVITLDILADNTKKSVSYKAKALEKSIVITDTIHGDATIIAKSDFDGYTIFGFEENNLMAKNALLDIDIWKTQFEELMKERKGKLRVAIKNHLLDEGRKHINEIHEHLLKHFDSLYDEVFDKDKLKLANYLKTQADDMKHVGNYKFEADANVLEKYETPEEYRKGEYKIYSRDDGNLQFLIQVGDKTLPWTIKIQNMDDVFNLFGKSTKFPAMVAENVSKEKLIDEGIVKLGVQRHGYHEYILDGDKFKTKLHFRVVPLEDEPRWIAFTSIEDDPVDPKSDEGIWNITQDKNNKLNFLGLD